MIRTFVELPIFRSRWKTLGLNDDDLKRLQEEVILDPKIGPVMKEPVALGKCALLWSIEEKVVVYE